MGCIVLKRWELEDFKQVVVAKFVAFFQVTPRFFLLRTQLREARERAPVRVFLHYGAQQNNAKRFSGAEMGIRYQRKPRPPQCGVCRHAERTLIDNELIAGVGVREVALRFQLARSSVGRHFQAHVAGAGDGDNWTGDGTAHKRLEASARKLLRRAEAKNDHKTTLEALRLLDGLQRRKRIAAAASSASSAQASASAASASATQRPIANQRNPSDLVSELRRIYGLTGPNWDALAHRPRTQAATQQWIEHLGLLVEETENTEPKIAAAATLLGSLLLHEPLDAETAGEVKNLLAGLDCGIGGSN
jgi:hypothetical protein